MIEFDRIWDRLVALARPGLGAGDDFVPPPGFSTRVAALAVAARTQVAASLSWESFALRGLAVACVISAATAVMGWPLAPDDTSPDDFAELADPLAEVALLE